ncbi:MAG: CoA-binding protein [Candidatus Zixiibacteriota bacterium]|nr:MAG: CoA-binding protein [candidate division Zixibacteria bacterium]
MAITTKRAAPGSRVAVLGASPKEDRYSFKAVKMLAEHGHKPIPVHPAGHVVNGIKALTSLDEIDQPVDTLTVYVNPKISSGELDRILKLRPRRVIFNPGAENEELAGKLEEAGIEVVRACTLVLLQTEQF